MPAIAHIGVGFAAKKLATGISVIYLIIAAELIEIAFFGFMAAGVESMPLPDKPPFSPYSHGVFSGIIWSLAAGLFTWLISRNKKTSIFIGLLVLSHTILDIIASPKLAFYPTDTKVPVFFDNSLSVGFGLFKNKAVALIFEFGVLLSGLLIYVLKRKSEMLQSTIK
ncbi:MAG TPA: hypothetical protein VK213_08550 [Bacteroidales bacterium]|nr:hypothetical protein [Bacteroidales bacterium]